MPEAIAIQIEKPFAQLCFLPFISTPRKLRHAPRRRLSTRCTPTAGPSASHDSSLYEVLGIHHPHPKSLAAAEIRRAYLSLAKTAHPDTAESSGNDFDAIAGAYAVLSDPQLRKVYDSSGKEGLAAVKSISQRTDDIRKRYASLSGEQLDYLSDTGQLVGGLLSASEMADDSFDPSDIDHDDACPRSVDEAIWNIQNHEDRSVRYYGLWWIYKFKVVEAEAALVNVLRTSYDQTSLGGFGLRRRAALALGAVASIPTKVNTDAVLALSDSLRSTDYFLRYRAAEALANVAQRSTLQSEVLPSFPDTVVHQLKLILNRGQKYLENKEQAKTGYSQQESLFDLEKFDPEVRARLEKIFTDRRQNEQRSRRTTMTPQLGVDEVGSDSDEPYEWVLKAVSAICSQRSLQDKVLVETIETYTNNPVPLVRYAAHKALYALTRESYHAEQIVKALDYGVEHHYSQRVLIRDLGDVGYSQGAAAVSSCPMVENSFKILALKNMLAKQKYDPEKPDVQNVLEHMDSLL